VNELRAEKVIHTNPHMEEKTVTSAVVVMEDVEDEKKLPSPLLTHRLSAAASVSTAVSLNLPGVTWAVIDAYQLWDVVKDKLFAKCLPFTDVVFKEPRTQQSVTLSKLTIDVEAALNGSASSPVVVVCPPLAFAGSANSGPAGGGSRISMVQIPALTMAHSVPLVRIILFSCETLEDYKSRKQDLKSIVETYSASSNPLDPHTVLLYLPLGSQAMVASTTKMSRAQSAAAAMAGLVGVGSSMNDPTAVYRKVFDKVKSDFQKEEKLKCSMVQLFDPNVGDEAESSKGSRSSMDLDLQWTNLAQTIKQAIVNSFQDRAEALEQSIRTHDAGRSDPKTMDYSALFCLKESFALMYTQFQQYDGAIRVLDELEAVQDEMFTNTGRASPPYDKSSRSILDLSLKPYRSLLIDHRLSELETRQYLFARQIAVLFACGRYDEAVQRCKKFIFSSWSSFISSMPDYSEVERVTWFVSAVLEVTRFWLIRSSKDSSILNSKEALSVLCDLLMQMLDILWTFGAFNKWFEMHDSMEFAASINTIPSLLEALSPDTIVSNQNSFLQGIVLISNTLSSLLRHVDKKKSATLVEYRLAQIYFKFVGLFFSSSNFFDQNKKLSDGSRNVSKADSRV
jgi:hypothetical protein